MRNATTFGYVMVETVVAMGLLSVSMVAIHGAVRQTVIARGQAQDYTIARFLLEEIVAKAGASSAEARKALINENKEAAFYSGKVHSARFFITKVLPLQAAKVKSIMDDDFAALEIDDVSFGEIVEPAAGA